MDDPVELGARRAFEGALQSVGPTPAGVTASERNGLCLAFVETRKGRTDLLGERLRSRFGLRAPTGPRRVAAGSLMWLGVGPGRWLAVAGAAEADFSDALAEALEGAASVIDQTDGLVVIRVSGPATRDLFAKGLPIDLDASAFPIDAVATSAIAHIAVTIWRLDDASTFEVALSRSVAGDFARWLCESAAEFGLWIE